MREASDALQTPHLDEAQSFQRSAGFSSGQIITGFYSADFHDEKNVVFILEKTGFFIENKK